MCKRVLKNKIWCYWATGHGLVLAEHGPVVRVPVTQTYRNLATGRVWWPRPRGEQVLDKTTVQRCAHGGVVVDHGPVVAICNL
ncbi:hypothetical protein HanIR_Chr04g0179921 [Helianthus annuus]|nr:hypothetical protein HanIR_Chr04g0179921 [Helianthus annuus]